MVAYESLDHMLGQNFASIAYGSCGDLPRANAVSLFFFWCEKSMSRKMLFFPLRNFSSLVLPRNTIMLQHLIIQFPLYYLSSGLLRGVKNKKKINILALKVVMVAYKGWLLRTGSEYCDLTGKLLVFWKKGCWGEVVAYERWPQPEVQLSWCSYSLYFTDCFSLFLAQTMVHFTNSGNMLVDDLKLFLHDLPPDCQESTLKDFLEGTRTHKLLNCWEPLFP